MKDVSDIADIMTEIGRAAKAAAAKLAFAPPEAKQKALEVAADAVWANCAEIIAANAKDMEFGRDKGLSPAMLDRLELTEDRIQSIVDGLRAVAAQDDPVGEVLTEWDQPFPEYNSEAACMRTPSVIRSPSYTIDVSWTKASTVNSYARSAARHPSPTSCWTSTRSS